MNDDLKVDIEYHGYVDQAIFNIILIFDSYTVGTKRFYYNSFK